MGSRLRQTVLGVFVVSAVIGGFAAGARAADRSADRQIAQAGVLGISDFPAGWTEKASSGPSDAAVEKLAESVAGCGPYLALRKLTDAQPQAKSHTFEDDSRRVSNEVDVFSSATAASKSLALYGKPAIPTCLERLFKKLLTQQFAKDPKTKGKIRGVQVSLTRQPISGLGDDSVVYEGTAKITGTDGSVQSVGLGNAAVQTGRAVDDFTYSTTSAELPEILTPAITASLARLHTALSRSSS